jgi:tRNA-specific 2-thiouridylase
MNTVYVGLSGGVDSSVSAALLQQQGYRVVGVYMKNWAQDIAGIECPWKQDLADAKAVAVALNIPFKVFDFQDQYKQKVVDYMVDEYKAGRTPNPDVMCNQEIKFKVFLEAALEDGADYIATGHYARVDNGDLHRAADAQKDQTYFLYRVSKRALERTLMPVGGLEKPQVRVLAAEFGLPTATKKDSQGICFVGKVGMKEFLRQYVEAQPGNVLHTDGRVLGTHDGAIFYTIGQRHGFGIGGGKPYFVLSKNMAANTITVTDNPVDLELHQDSFRVTNVHWIDKEPTTGDIVQVRTRYREPLISTKMTKTSDDVWDIEMASEARALTPGQSAVFYDGSRVLGGGIITTT